MAATGSSTPVPACDRRTICCIATPSRFDDISLSAGYLGDTSTPSVFARADRLDDHNCAHVLVGKKLAARASVSVDWTVVDAVRVENYERTTGTRDQGFAITAATASSSTPSCRSSRT